MVELFSAWYAKFHLLLPLLLITGGGGVTATSAQPQELALPKWFGNGMVLQTNAEYGARSFISGVAKPGSNVNVNVDGNRDFPAVADEDTGDEKISEVCIVSTTFHRN